MPITLITPITKTIAKLSNVITKDLRIFLTQLRQLQWLRQLRWLFLEGSNLNYVITPITEAFFSRRKISITWSQWVIEIFQPNYANYSDYANYGGSFFPKKYLNHVITKGVGNFFGPITSITVITSRLKKFFRQKAQLRNYSNYAITKNPKPSTYLAISKIKADNMGVWNLIWAPSSWWQNHEKD